MVMHFLGIGLVVLDTVVQNICTWPWYFLEMMFCSYIHMYMYVIFIVQYT